MRRISTYLLLFFCLLGTPESHADGPPAANVSCSLTDLGVRYGVSMVFTGSGISFNSLKYEWEYSVAASGKNASLISSYSPRQLYSVTNGNGLDLTYENLLGLANNDPGSSVLIYANSVFSDGVSTLTNKTGKGCYVELPIVLKNKTDQAAAVLKAAADKAAADKAAQEREQIQKIFEGLKVKSQSADELIAKYSKSDFRIAANLKKFAFSKPVIPDSIPFGYSYQDALDLDAKFSTFQSNLERFIKSLLKNAPKTISCIKGKEIKKISGISPKCPPGFKQKP